MDRASSAGFQQAPAATWKLVPLMCTCGDLREAYD
jgi:hypothetical protein